MVVNHVNVRVLPHFQFQRPFQRSLHNDILQCMQKEKLRCRIAELVSAVFMYSKSRKVHAILCRLPIKQDGD